MIVVDLAGEREPKATGPCDGTRRLMREGSRIVARRPSTIGDGRSGWADDGRTRQPVYCCALGSKGPAPVALGRPPFDNGTRRNADRPVYASRYPSPSAASGILTRRAETSNAQALFMSSPPGRP